MNISISGGLDYNPLGKLGSVMARSGGMTRRAERPARTINRRGTGALGQIARMGGQRADIVD